MTELGVDDRADETRTGHDRTGNSWREEGTAVVQAAAGGLLFGIPLLYTMEMWWVGSRASAIQLFGLLLLTVVIVTVLNRTDGFRSHPDVRWRDALMDTVVAIGVGLVVVTLVLVVLREVQVGMPVGMAVGKIVYQLVPFAIGIGVAHHFLRGGRDERDEHDSQGTGAGAATGAERDDVRSTFADIGATTIGALFIALNIAPTDEVPLLSSAMSALWLMVLVLMTVVVTYLIVFVAGFSGQEQRRAQEGVLQHPITETAACYLVSLLAALALLWLFGRTDGPWPTTLSYVVVLGLPAAVGGAAGRLAL